VAAYAVATACFVPRPPFTLTAGVLFGPLLGGGIALGSSLLSAALGFWLGRTGLAGLSERLADRYRWLQALDAVARRQPARLTAWWHLSLVLPFALINIWMGAIKAPFWRFMAGKLLGVIPGTVLYVGLGAAATELTAATDHVAYRVGLGVGVVCSAALVWWLNRAARAELAGLKEPPSATVRQV
jgi:uncharacterized membrane protein YdjX (TVP38/TMEM64 family)